MSKRKKNRKPVVGQREAERIAGRKRYGSWRDVLTDNPIYGICKCGAWFKETLKDNEGKVCKKCGASLSVVDRKDE